MKILPKPPAEWMPYQTSAHRIALKAGITFVVYGLVALLLTITMMLIRIPDSSIFFDGFGLSMIIVPVLGLLIIYITTTSLRSKYEKDHPAAKELADFPAAEEEDRRTRRVTKYDLWNAGISVALLLSFFIVTQIFYHIPQKTAIRYSIPLVIIGIFVERYIRRKMTEKYRIQSINKTSAEQQNRGDRK
jgi:hypothetical protein